MLLNTRVFKMLEKLFVKGDTGELSSLKKGLPEDLKEH
jgi:hypothetical protein